MKFKCKLCYKNEKIKSIDDLVCDRSDCIVKYPGEYEVLSWDSLRKDKIPPVILEDLEVAPEPIVNSVGVSEMDLWGNYIGIPDPNFGEFPTDIDDAKPYKPNHVGG